MDVRTVISSIENLEGKLKEYALWHFAARRRALQELENVEGAIAEPIGQNTSTGNRIGRARYLFERALASTLSIFGVKMK